MYVHVVDRGINSAPTIYRAWEGAPISIFVIARNEAISKQRRDVEKIAAPKNGSQ